MSVLFEKTEIKGMELKNRLVRKLPCCNYDLMKFLKFIFKSL